jgi:Tol biopolymer transport system component
MTALVLALFTAGLWPPIAHAQSPCTFTQITNTTQDVGSFQPSISSDGTRIAFYSNGDLTGGNTETFLWTLGSGFTQITATTVGENTARSINADGTRIALLSSSDLTPGIPGNLDGNREVFLWTQGSGFTQITNTTGGGAAATSISADGTRIAFESSNDITPGIPGNADGNPEIFLWTQSTGLTQLTNSTGGGSNDDPAINTDGTRIAFSSDRDLTGGNADHGYEIFLATCSGASAGIPTLSEWAQLGMAALLLGGGLLALRKKGQVV